MVMLKTHWKHAQHPHVGQTVLVILSKWCLKCC